MSHDWEKEFDHLFVNPQNPERWAEEVRITPDLIKGFIKEQQNRVTWTATARLSSSDFMRHASLLTRIRRWFKK